LAAEIPTIYMMAGTGKPYRRRAALGLILAVLLALAAGIAAARPVAPRRARRPPPRVVTVREVIVRREPVHIHAVTLAQLRAELRRTRLAQTGYERQIAQQYATIRQLQTRLETQMRKAQEEAAQRSAQLDEQFEIILQAFGVVIFAIIGALLVALSRSHAPPSREPERAPLIDWEPVQHQLQEARSALASVDLRLQRLERQ
jgi:hypothetical protein